MRTGRLQRCRMFRPEVAKAMKRAADKMGVAESDLYTRAAVVFLVEYLEWEPPEGMMELP